VYPAAGLINYLREDVQKFVIDKSIPKTGSLKNCTFLEMEATKGVREMTKILLERK
jgi:NAD-dependent deacetylase